MEKGGRPEPPAELMIHPPSLLSIVSSLAQPNPPAPRCSLQEPPRAALDFHYIAAALADRRGAWMFAWDETRPLNTAVADRRALLRMRVPISSRVPPLRALARALADAETTVAQYAGPQRATSMTMLRLGLVQRPSTDAAALVAVVAAAAGAAAGADARLASSRMDKNCFMTHH